MRLRDIHIPHGELTAHLESLRVAKAARGQLVGYSREARQLEDRGVPKKNGLCTVSGHNRAEPASFSIVGTTTERPSCLSDSPRMGNSPWTPNPCSLGSSEITPLNAMQFKSRHRAGTMGRRTRLRYVAL